jgi:2-haloacid dehalogenase
MATRPQSIAFDVMGTLFPLDALRDSVTKLGLPPQSLEVWIARTLRDGFALAATGAFQPFHEVAAGTLDGLLAEHGQDENASGVAEVLAGLARLPARPEAGAAMTRLRAAGIRVIALTNASHENTRTLLEGASLEHFVERVISIDDIHMWKPRSEVYTHAASEAGIEPGKLGLVAAHAWDCHGAGRAGLTTGWVSRPEMRFNPALGCPDVQGETLTAVVDALLGLPNGHRFGGSAE